MAYIKLENVIAEINKLPWFPIDSVQWVKDVLLKDVLHRIPIENVIELKHAYWTGILPRDYAHAEGLPANATEEERRAYKDHFDNITHCSNCLGMFDARIVKNWKACPYCLALMDGHAEEDTLEKILNDLCGCVDSVFLNYDKELAGSLELIAARFKEYVEKLKEEKKND